MKQKRENVGGSFLRALPAKKTKDRGKTVLFCMRKNEKGSHLANNGGKTDGMRGTVIDGHGIPQDGR